MSNVNVKSKVLKIRNLPTDGRKIDQINAKPYLVIAVFLFIGIALLFTRVYLIAKWSITSSSNDLDVLNIELKNHQCISLKCVSRKKVEKYFLQYATPIRESEITKQHAL